MAQWDGSAHSAILVVVLFSTVNFTVTFGPTQFSPRVVGTRHTQWQGILGPTDLQGKKFSPRKYNAVDVEIFKGIPYAIPPIRQMRYARPEHITLLANTTYIANETKPECPNDFERLKVYDGPNLYERIKSDLRLEALEDCLYLDIYVPTAFAKTSGLPVLAYANSHADDPEEPFDGSSLAAIGNLIVVSFRYRVGVLGFLSPTYSQDKRMTNNYGLWDQLLALHWIQENIGGFGGDKTNVTLAGFDQDAVFAGILAMSTFSQASGGLFHRLILLNGSPLSPLGINHHPLITTAKMALDLNCYRPEMNLVDCFRKQKLNQLLKVAGNMEFALFNNPFAPSMDETLVTDVLDNVNSIYANEAALKELLGKYDLMCGLSEGTVLPNIGQVQSLWQNLELDKFVTAVLQLALKLEQGTEPKVSLHEEVKRAIINQYGDPFPPYIRDILADFITVFPTINLLNLHSQTKKNTFFYVSKNFNPLGKTKNIDISYLFTNSVYRWKYTDYEQNADLEPYVLLIKFIANFVKSGDPNPVDRFSTTPRAAPWPKYRFDRGNFLRFGRNVDITGTLKYRQKYMEFWAHAFPAIVNNSLSSEQLNEKTTPMFPMHLPKPGYPTMTSQPIPGSTSGSEATSDIPVVTSMIQNTVLMGAMFLLIVNFLCCLAIMYQRKHLKRIERQRRDRMALAAEESHETRPEIAGQVNAGMGVMPSSSASEPYGYIRQVPAPVPLPTRAPLDTMSETETDNGFGSDFLGPNYDPRTKVTRWMFQQRNSGSGGGSLDRPDPPDGIPMTSMVPYGTSGSGHGPMVSPHTGMKTTTLMNQPQFYNQPFQPSLPSDIPYADSRATTPSVVNYQYGGQVPPSNSAFNNNLSTNNFNNPRRCFIPSPSNSGTTTLSYTDSHQYQPHRRSKMFFPLHNNSVIVQEVDLEEFPNGGDSSGLIVTDDLEVQSSRPKLVPVKNSGTLTRSVGVGATSANEGDDSIPLLPGITIRPDETAGRAGPSRQVKFADEIL